MSLVHSATFRVARRRTNFLHYESLDNWVFQKLPWRPETAGFMMSLCLHYILKGYVFCDTTGIISFEWRKNSVLQKVRETTDISFFMIIAMSVVHSASLRRVRSTSVVCYEWRCNSSFQKVLQTTHTSCFMMIFMSLVYSASFSLVRRRTNFLYYESQDNLIFQNIHEDLKWPVLWWFWCP